jgi:hypothetical protein
VVQVPAAKNQESYRSDYDNNGFFRKVGV